jgi:hypothetical protein
MSISKRPVIAGTIAAVALVAIAMLSSGWSVAGSSPAPSAAAHPSAVRVHPPSAYIDTVVQQKWLAPGPAHLGDTTAVSSNLTDLANQPIGTESFTCTVVGVGPPTDLLQCTGTAVFANGTTEASFALKRSDIETVGGHYTTAIVGGTGAFIGAKGQAHWTVLAAGVSEADKVTIK